MSDNNRHPSSMSAEEKQALINSDPAAFEDDNATTPPPAPGATAPAAAPGEGGAEPAAPPAAASAAAPPAEPQEPPKSGAASDAPPPMVPKARLNEVIEQRNAAETLAKQQAQELADLRAKMASNAAPKDFDAEFDALQKKYDAGEMSDSEFNSASRKLSTEETRYIARTQALATQHETTAESYKRTWEEEARDWAARNPGFLTSDENVAAFDRALAATVTMYGDQISNATLLEKASKMAFEVTGYQPPNAPAVADPNAPRAGDDRRAQNAARTTAAATTPPTISGGVGARGGPDRDVDMKAIKPGSFSKMSKAEQERLLGEGAL